MGGQDEGKDGGLGWHQKDDKIFSPSGFKSPQLIVFYCYLDTLAINNDAWRYMD